jgi:hypothetical protein
LDTSPSFFRIVVDNLSQEPTMKLKPLILSLAMALGSASSMAVTQNLGTLDASGTDFDQTFVSIFGYGSPQGHFTDYYTFSLVAPATGAAGAAQVETQWGAVALNLTSISLYGSAGQLLASSAPGSFSFSGLGAGTYKLAVAGDYQGLLGVASYSGTIRSIASAAPEASSFAMALLGLVGVGAMVARRRKA